MRWILLLFVLTLVPVNVVEAGPKVRTRYELTLEAVDKIVETAEKEAAKRKAKVVIAVVDAGGELIVLRRLDGAQVASVGVAVDKARTAAIYRRRSKDFEDQVTSGRVSALALHRATPLQGGIPIKYKDEIVGAIGVSGETPQIDEDIAFEGAKAANKF